MVHTVVYTTLKLLSVSKVYSVDVEFHFEPVKHLHTTKVNSHKVNCWLRH